MVAFREERIGPCRLILGDCHDVLPTLASVGAVVTDPPYGIGITKSARLAKSRGMGGKSWDDKPADVAPLLGLSVPTIIWGGNYFDLPPCRGPLVWDKNNAGRDFADFEMAWTNLDQVARRMVLRPMNMDGGKVHPTQKPIQVMAWCLDFLPEIAAPVLDPYMGSGSTLVAAARRGMPATGIEVDPEYFDIACGRVEAACREPDLFAAPAEPLVQSGFDL